MSAASYPLAYISAAKIYAIRKTARGRTLSWVLATDIGERLRDLRKVLEWGQEQLGTRLGRRYQQVSNWENGKQRPPKGALERLARDEGWPIEIFSEGGRMPSAVLKRGSNRVGVAEPSAEYRRGSDYDEAAGPVEGAGWTSWSEEEADERLRDIVRHATRTTRGMITDEASIRGIRLAVCEGLMKSWASGLLRSTSEDTHTIPKILRQIHREVEEGSFK